MSVTVTCPCCGIGEITVSINPGEPMVHYYPDGSGYPGDPPYVEEVIDSSCECLDYTFTTWSEKDGRKVRHDEGVPGLWERIEEAAMSRYDPADADDRDWDS